MCVCFAYIWSRVVNQQDKRIQQAKQSNENKWTHTHIRQANPMKSAFTLANFRPVLFVHLFFAMVSVFVEKFFFLLVKRWSNWWYYAIALTYTAIVVGGIISTTSRKLHGTDSNLMFDHISMCVLFRLFCWWFFTWIWLDQQKRVALH